MSSLLAGLYSLIACTTWVVTRSFQEELPACLDAHLSEAYIAKVPTLDRLLLLDQIFEAQDCLSVQLPEGQITGSPGGIGPPDFVRQMQAYTQAVPELRQLQEVGVQVDPEPLLAIEAACSHRSIVDAERPLEVQQWRMCHLYSDGRVTNDWDKVASELRFFIEPLLSSGTLLKVMFSSLGPSDLIEWHADYAFNLLSESGRRCDVDAETFFKNYEREDRELTRVRLHVPLSDQGNVSVFVSGSRVHLRTGEVTVFDFYQPHSLYNSGQSSRINLLLDFDLRALHNETNTRQLLKFEVGRKIMAAVLRIGYQHQHLNLAREQLGKSLYDHQQAICKESRRLNSTLQDVDEIKRVMTERQYAGLPAIKAPASCSTDIHLGCVEWPNMHTQNHSMRRVDTRFLQIQNYSLDFCLGAGHDWEVWSGQLPDGTSHALKLSVASSSNKTDEFLYLQAMCERSNALKSHNPDHFVACHGFGLVELSNAMEPSKLELVAWIALEQISGATMKSLFKRREECDKPVLTHLSAAFEMALDFYSLIEAGIRPTYYNGSRLRPDDDDGFRYHFGDPHWDQLIISYHERPSAVVWMDYDDDAVIACTEHDHDGAVTSRTTDVSACDEKSPVGKCWAYAELAFASVHMLLLLVSDLSTREVRQLLLPFTEEAERCGDLSIDDFGHETPGMRGTKVLDDARQATEYISENLFPEFAQDWMKFQDILPNLFLSLFPQYPAPVVELMQYALTLI